MTHTTVSHDDPGAMHYRAKDTAAGMPGPACSPAYVPAGGCGVTDDPNLVTCSICDAREARNLRAVASLTATLAAIVAHLPGWSLDTDHADYGTRAPHLVRADGVTLWVHVATYGPGAGRLEISAGVPDGASYPDGDTGREPRPRITVDPTRPAEKLAADISRRLIGAAVDYWQTVSARIAARLARLSTAETVARELAAILGQSEPWQDNNRYWRGYLPVAGHYETWDGETVTVELRNLPADRARELATLISGWRA